MKETVIAIFEDVLGCEDLIENQDLNLFEEELLDSLAIIEVLLEIEGRLGIELQPTDLEREDMSTVNKLVKFLESR